MDWRWVVSSTLRFWVMVGVLLALAAGVKLYWFRLPAWARWTGLAIVGLLGLALLVAGLTNLVADLCGAPRREAVSMLLILTATLAILVAVYLKLVADHVKQLRRVIEALKRRVAADHPHDDVLVAEDGSVTFRPRTR